MFTFFIRRGWARNLAASLPPAGRAEAPASLFPLCQQCYSRYGSAPPPGVSNGVGRLVCRRGGFSRRRVAKAVVRRRLKPPLHPSLQSPIPPISESTPSMSKAKANGNNVKALPPRSKVKPRDCWDLSTLFKTDADWEAAFGKWEEQV